MSLRKCFLVLLYTLSASGVFSQGWEKEFVDEMWPYQMLETADGGYLISGFYTVEAPGTFVTKINAFGDQGWHINFVEGGGVLLQGPLVRTADGNVVFRVRTKIEVNGSEFVKHKFIKIDEAGNILWEHILNESEEAINYIGDFFAEADSSITFPARIGEDHYVGNLDINGSITSLNPSPGFSYYPNFSQTSDGRYYYEATAAGSTLVIQETNQNGDSLNQILYPGRATGEVFLLANNELIIFESNDNFSGLRQVRIDSSNNLLDADTLWNSTRLYSGNTLMLDDGFLHTGSTRPIDNSPPSIVVTKSDFDGNIIWQKNYKHRSGRQDGNKTFPTADGGHMTLGVYHPGVRTGSSVGPAQDAYLIKSDEEGAIYSNVISGIVKIDANENCTVDSMEVPIEDWIITATKESKTFVTTTNSNGEYILPIDTGAYIVTLHLPNSYWSPCVNDVPVNFTTINNTNLINFEVQEIIDCPNMAVNGSVASLRPCVVRPSYINYHNYGTVIAENAYIDIAYDAFISPVSSSIHWENLPNNVYRFELGDIPPLASGNINIDLMLDCDATIGASYCIEANIFPDSLCTSPDPNWSGAFLEVNGTCDDNELRFRIENTGDGGMDGFSHYIIVEDVVLLEIDSIEFEPGEFSEDTLLANGSTFAILVDQTPDAPGKSYPMAVVEGCGENIDGDFSVGFVHQFAFDDADVYQDIDCAIAVNSFDPNDKQGFPLGYKSPHFIQPSTPVEYLIRFQNTGTDTAYTVVIRDTIDQHFDIATFESGASSHPYYLDMEGEGILKFTFDNINLPDSIANLAASNGFVEFKITPKETLPLGTVIYNNAGIYFDLNEPVITNETFHTISQDYIEVISEVMGHPTISNIEINVYPNPFRDQARLEIKNHSTSNSHYRIEIVNIDGVLLRMEESFSPIIDIKKENLVKGLYFYRIYSDDGFSNSGRLIIH